MKPLLSYEKIKEYVKRTHTKRIRPLNRVEKSRGEYYLPPPHPFFLPPFFLPPFLPPHLAILITSFHGSHFESLMNNYSETSTQDDQVLASLPLLYFL